MQISDAKEHFIKSAKDCPLEVLQELYEADSSIAKSIKTKAISRSLLAAAEYNGDPRVALWLIDCGVDVKVNEKSRDRWHALHFAARSGNVALIRKIIEFGEDPNTGHWQSNPPLALAAIHGEVAAIHALIDLGTSTEGPNNRAQTALHLAKTAEATSALLSRGAKINARDDENKTPLHHVASLRYSRDENDRSALNEKVSQLGVLFAAGIDHAAEDYRGRTAFRTAQLGNLFFLQKKMIDSGVVVSKNELNELFLSRCKKGDIDEIQYCLQKGAYIGATTVSGYQCALSVAILENEDRSIVRFILEEMLRAGRSIREFETVGETPLHHAAQSGDAELCIELIRHGASPNDHFPCRESALSMACEKGHVDVVKALLSHGADTEAILYGEKTALFVCRGKSAMQCLVDAGANINYQLNSKNFAIHEFSYDFGIDHLRLLLDAGADINARGKNDYTPAMKAASNGQYKALDFLLSSGADPDIVTRKKESLASVFAKDPEGRQFLSAWRASQAMKAVLNSARSAP